MDILRTPGTTVRRQADRGAYDAETIRAILDEGLVCHVGFVADGRPVVIPTAYARIGDEIVLHGAVASRMLRALTRGIEICATVTLLDGLVLARSAFSSSMNYRSVVVMGRARAVTDHEEKRRALDALVEHLVPGRMSELRAHTEEEIRATVVVALPVREASAKIRTGPPHDKEADVSLPVWAGVIPLWQQPLPGIPAPDGPEVEAPDHVTRYRRPSDPPPGSVAG